MTVLDSRTSLPVQLPASGSVARFAPEAAEVIDRFTELERSLPPRPSAEEVNELDDLRGQAYSMLHDSALDEKRAKDRQQRHKELAKLLDAVDVLWQQEEIDRGFENWRRGSIQCVPVPLTIGKVRTGAGMSIDLRGREVLRQLREAVGS